MDEPDVGESDYDERSSVGELSGDDGDFSDEDLEEDE